VSALATRALDHHTWKNHYPAGVTRLNGVEVERFDAETRLGEAAMGRIGQSIMRGEALSAEDQRTWLSGVVSSAGLLEHISASGSRYTHLIFLPYLFGTTFLGSAVKPEISYIIPCLHDEPFAYLSLIMRMLGCARGLIFNSPGERRLASRLLEVQDPGPVVGMGFSPLAGDTGAFYDRFPVRGDFLLYAGRREEGKNTPLLVDHFCRFAAEQDRRLSLVLMGAGEVRVPPAFSRVVFDLGRVSEQEKWDGYTAACAFCQPSVNESLSIVLLESWLAGRPALVNRECEVTSEHARASGGGIAFGDYDEFAAALSMLLDDRGLARSLGEAGRCYVLEQYNWDSVVERLLGALGVGEG